MGIKGLTPKFITLYAPGGIVLVPVEGFRGKRIAIDADNWLRSLWSVAHKQHIQEIDVVNDEINRDEIFKLGLTMVKEVITKFHSYKITPIFVFDGKYPEIKKKEQEKRQEHKQKVQTFIINEREILKNADLIELTSERISKLRTKMCQDTKLTKDDCSGITNILVNLGIPVLKAEGEGEQLCAMLELEGKVDAVLSTDTDILVYGVKNLITEYNGYSFKMILLDKVLEQSGFTFEMFVDVCIMFGCDYNTNIPKIGNKRAYELIKNFHSIDQLPEFYGKFPLDRKVLNYEACRQQFSYVTSDSISKTPIELNLTAPSEICRDLLDQYELGSWLNEILNFRV